MGTLATAIAAWREVLGSDYVITDQDILAQAQTATFRTTQEIPAILQPANVVEVQKCVCIANEYVISLYPISGGKNWGYGSRVPVQSGCVLIDLSRLNRIIEYNERLAYVKVEPGVTMRHLYQFLEKHNSPLFLSATGGTMDGSLIGNVLERGLGAGRYAERFNHVCELEVVLPTGECIHTGFARYPHAQSGSVSRWSVGPYFDGMFTQSNLGIVTQMTIWLLPKPQAVNVCLFTLKEDVSLDTLIDALHTIKFEGGCAAPIHLYNDYKLLSLFTQYPAAITAERPFLTSELMGTIRNTLRFGAWSGAITLQYASKRLCDAMCDYIQETLQGKVDSLRFLQGVEEIAKTDALYDTGVFDLARVQSGLDNVNDGGIRSTYWRKRKPVPATMNPDRDGCGIIWCAPIVPFTGEHVRRAKDIIEQTCFAHHMEPHITIVCIEERSVIVNAVLIYDREIVGEDEQAKACYDDLLQKLAMQGYFPYRLGIHSMEALPLPMDASSTLLKRVKNALDPNDILAPGRYDFRTSWE